ncbi:M48 family metalloprotease [Streptomyces sp. NPDC050287]|uniref:M48 family metalloprotease n=1 Tax=Streptomyces sp. NPDC050287 TaxID=3365608 RepID=UPI0037A0056A
MDSPISLPSPRPSAAREWLLITAMVTVAWLPLIGLGLVLLILGVTFGIWQVAVAPVMWVLIGVSRTVLGRDSVPGRAVRPGDEPELASLVNDVAERLRFTAPLLVRIVPWPDAALGRAKVAGVRSHVLLLGLPLLRNLSAAQLAAVIGHELAHEQHIHDRRTSWLHDARALLAERLEGRFRPLAPLATPLLRASQPRVWQAERSADADAARIAGTETTRQVLELVALLVATFDGLGEQWLTDLAVNHTYPQDFYDAFDAALQDPLVRRRSAGAAAEYDVLDPYHTANHPPVAQRIAALPQADGCTSHGSDPIRLRGAALIAQWCVQQLAGVDSLPEPRGTQARTSEDDRRARRRGKDRYDDPRPVHILGLDAEQLHAPSEDGGPEALLAATRTQAPLRAVSAALDAVADGSWPRLARRIEPQLRRLPPVERPTATRDVLAGATGAALVPVLREAGWTYASRWMRTVLTTPGGTNVDLYDLLVTAVDMGDPAPVRFLLEAAGTEEVPA